MTIVYASKYTPLEALHTAIKESGMVSPVMQEQQHGWTVATSITKLVNEEPRLWVAAIEKAIWQDWDRRSRYRDEDSWYQRVYLTVEVDGHNQDVCVVLPYMPDNLTVQRIADWYVNELDPDTTIVGIGDLTEVEDTLENRMMMASHIIAHDPSGYQDRTYAYLLAWWSNQN